MRSGVSHFTLENGLSVIAKPVHTVPVTSVYIWYRVGSRNEPAGQSGLAHFLEHMLFKETKQFPNGEISRLIERTGGHQNAFTSNDYTAFFETVPKEYLELALRIEADRMHRAVLNPGEFEKERTVILSELDGNKNHPHVRFRDLLNAQTWLTHPYRRPIIGWRKEVEGLTIKQLREFYRRYYRPSNATLVVVGDFQMERLRSMTKRYFGVVHRGGTLPACETPSEAQQGERRVNLNDYGSAAMVQIQLPIPPAGHPAHHRIAVLNEVLTRGKTARLYQALVDKGLATGVTGAPYEMIDQGVWSFRAICQHGVEPAEVEKVILDEFEKIKTKPLMTRELRQAINQTRAELVFSQDSITEQAMLLGFYQTVAKDWKLPERYLKELAEVKREQIMQTAKHYLDREHMTIGHFYPRNDRAALPTGEMKDQRQSLLPAYQVRSGVDAGVLPVLKSAGTKKKKVTRRSPYKRIVLPNGLVLIVQENKSNPMFVLSGLVKGGIIQEPANLPGLATVHGQMLDRGTKRLTAQQFAGALEYKGAELYFTPKQEMLNISGEALTEDLELVLRLLAQALQQPVFNRTELEKIRQKVLTSCMIAQDNLEMQAWQGFQELAYPKNHPMARSLLRAEAGVLKLRQGDVARFHQKVVQPRNVILSISGAVRAKDVENLIKKYFGRWKNRETQSILLDPEPMPEVTDTRKKITTLPGKSESIVVLGHEGIHRKDEQYYALFVANQILGGAGLSSLLMQEVREKAGLTYSIYSQFKLVHGKRPWCIVFQTEPDRVDRAVSLALAQVNKLRKGRIAPHFLSDNKERLIGNLAMSMENNSGIAYLNREIEYHDLGPDYPAEFAQSIRKISQQQIIQAAHAWFHPDRYLLSIAAPKK